MKTFSNILATLLVALFLLTFGMKSEAISGYCKPGWTHVTDTVTVDGCQYEVNLCILCRHAYPGEIQIHSYFNLNGCGTSLNNEEIFQGILLQLSTYATVFFDNCQQGVVPPCKEDVIQYILDVPICWKVQLIYKDPNYPILNKYLYFPCEDGAYCQTTYSYCMGPYGLQHSTSNPILQNQPINCTIEGAKVALPVILGEESECYIIHTDCNP